MHAEQNAVIFASPAERQGATLYLAGWDVELKAAVVDPRPCALCFRILQNSGVRQVVTPVGKITLGVDS